MYGDKTLSLQIKIMKGNIKMSALYELLKGLILYFEKNARDEFFWLDAFFGLFK